MCLPHLPTPCTPWSSKKHPGTYIQWNLPLSIWNDLLDEVGRDSFPPLFLEDDAWLEGCMSSDKLRSEYLLETHWRMMLIGTKGAGMFNHQDTLRTASWQAQIKGSKSWHLCGPSEVTKTVACVCGAGAGGARKALAHSSHLVATKPDAAVLYAEPTHVQCRRCGHIRAKL